MRKIILSILLIMIIACSSFLIYSFINRKTDDETSKFQANSTTDIETIESNRESVLTYEGIMNYINKSGTRMIVIGKTGCTYCDNYKPVLEETSKEYNFDYLYIDVTKLTNEDFNLFFHSDIVIPGKCRNDGKDSNLLSGFGTPMTLFIQDKTSYNCIRGYVNKYNLVNNLKSIAFIN